MSNQGGYTRVQAELSSAINRYFGGYIVAFLALIGLTTAADKDFAESRVGSESTKQPVENLVSPGEVDAAQKSGKPVNIGGKTFEAGQQPAARERY